MPRPGVEAARKLRGGHPTAATGSHPRPQPMSLSRQAYRRALRPSGSSAQDHPWVSDDLIAAAFHRFVHGHRRHGSSVPGPLEARRRLAKRRNTALAGISGAEDIACLFGRNGREHMKWTDHPWQRSHVEIPDRSSYAVASHETTLPFYDHNPESIIPEHSGAVRDEAQPTTTQIFDQFLERDDWTPEYARDFTRRLGIDLQREPSYSRQIFNNLLLRPAVNLPQAIDFLDDPFLNTRGSGNYLAAVEFIQKRKRVTRKVLSAVSRGLELGLVPTDELCMILKVLPQIAVEKQSSTGQEGQQVLQAYYRDMWEAIGRCNILGYHDLDKDIVDAWVEEALKAGIVSLAEEIVIATHNANSDSYWPTALILMYWENAAESINKIPRQSPGALLSQLEPNCATKCIVEITELLARRTEKGRERLLDEWQFALLEVSNASIIADSQFWTDLPLAYTSDLSSHSRMQIQRQIVSRLWALRTLSRSLGAMHIKGLRATDHPAYVLLHLYESVTMYNERSFLTNFLRGIHDLDLPYSGLLLLAVNLKLRKTLQKAGRETLAQLETSQTTLAAVWEDPGAHKGVWNLFHGSWEESVRDVNLTSPALAEKFLNLARTGNSQKAWAIIRLLKNHTPFKICLHKAWVPLPHPDEKVLVRYNPGPRNSQCPDPYAAADLIHKLAVAFSCSRELSPSRAYNLVYTLYYFSRVHGAPVYPSMVRAMYHAGVVRYRREGLRVSSARYEYIMWIINKFEGVDVVRQLNENPELGSFTIEGHGT